MMIAISRLMPWVIAGSVWLAAPAWPASVDETRLGEAVERHLADEVGTMQWVLDPETNATQAGDTLELREVAAEQLETIKLTNLVPPVFFESGVAEIPASTVQSLEEILEGMRDRLNVRLHLIGHADNQALSPALIEQYGDNEGLSRERAGEVAEHFQRELVLPAEAISYEWAGDSRPVASNLTEAGRSLNRRVEIEVWYDEPREETLLQEVLVTQDMSRVKVCRVQTVCKLSYVAGVNRRARVRNLIAPLHYEAGSIEVTQSFIDEVRHNLDNLSDRQNVVVRFVGFTDDVPLAGRAARIYGDHVGLSKARARRVALAVQEGLGLSTASVESDGKGAERPLEANEKAQGRARNRRVEIEFWYDDPLQELPDEPQLCPEAAQAEMVTRVYDPPWGTIEPIQFSDGSPVVPAGYMGKLRRALGDIADRANVRLRFAGYTRNERLTRRTADVYGDDIGFSASRARRAMDAIVAEMDVEAGRHEFEGRGYVHSGDVVNAGFIQGESSHVAVEVVYDEPAVFDDLEGVSVTRMRRELSPRNPLGLNLMRITVDGVPIDDVNRSSSDIQRCTDVAMDGADIRFGFDTLRAAPRLAGAVSPQRIRISRVIDYETRVTPVRFSMYANYAAFIDRAEVRVFERGASLESQPLDVIDIDVNGMVDWIPPTFWFKGPVHELAYVIRAYGRDGNFDETQPQPLWVMYGEVDPEQGPDGDGLSQNDPELLAGYGQNRLGLQNIALGSGTVSVRGEATAAGEQVYVAGQAVPVGDGGAFVAQEVLPDGVHTVEVAVVDEEGAGNIYLRDLELQSHDWFYVGMADLTLATSSSSGSIDLLQGANSDQAIDSEADGRLAFFVDGKFADDWRLMASADTREGPVEDLFSNFMDKSPESLFRRIDPDYFYPTFGDDGTVQELAPTQGKFFVKVSDDNSSAQWGNFNASYLNNELGQIDRGLYGANVRYQTDSATSFGQKRLVVDAFAADPGTVPARDELRGTGGSLYFLNRQDILTGSERVRIELRDKASGLVSGVVNLTPVIDYDIDYLQGRIVLNEALPSSATDGLLVRDSGASGDAVFLVVRYEYTPGFDDVGGVATGTQASAWLGDYLKLGVTAGSNGQGDVDSSLAAADATLRLDARSWLKIQQARSDGQAATPLISGDGGFEFGAYDSAAFADTDATASRADLSFSSAEMFGYGDTLLTAYVQDAEAGYSSAGIVALTDTTVFGGALSMPLAKALDVEGRFDRSTQDLGLETEAYEIDLGYQLSYRWGISAGYRADERTDQSPLVPLTQEQGKRTDVVVQLDYDSKEYWSTYTFLQDTLSTTGNRSENSRLGVGGAYRVGERLELEAELSTGDLGPGGRVGSSYLLSDRTTAYVNYALENEQGAGEGVIVGRGGQGSLVAGVKTRWSDSTSVFVEERYAHDDLTSGLTHSSGVSLSLADAWHFGVNTDIGTLQNRQTGAETDRVAGGFQVGATFQALQFSTGLEYRNDEAEQPDLSQTERRTWLFRSNLKYQFNPAARLVGKLDHSDSESSLGTFYDGGFTEAVLGFAYRPVNNDRLNMLTKYTYFYNVPTVDQVSLQGLPAEFIQKSHVAALDVTYDLTRWFSVGGKYAHRLGQISMDREASDFFDNNADLYVLRGDFRFRRNWEALVEGRVLDMPDLKDRRSGALFTVSRYLGDHLKIGLGYNFTDFSDDLTDLSFDHHGVFLNLVGSL